MDVPLWKKIKNALSGTAPDEVTEEEIMSLVDEGTEKGVLEDSEAEMIRNIISLDEKDAKDIMTHRKNMVTLDASMTLDEAVSFILDQTNSKFPVTDGDIDTIMGTIHIRDAFNYYRREEYRNVPVSRITSLIRQAVFIPETRDIYRLFRQMQAEKNHMAIVIDEYGQTSGLVTMEDILEEIVGNILDEYDKEEKEIIPIPGEGFVIQGLTPLEDIEELLGISFNDDENETLNGFLVSRLDRIPEEKEKEEIFYGGYRFKILQVGNRTIRKVLAAPAKETDNEKE